MFTIDQILNIYKNNYFNLFNKFFQFFISKEEFVYF